MKIKSLLIFTLLVLMVSLFLSTQVLADGNSEATKGLLYNDYEKYTYFVKHISKYDYGTETSITVPISITVRDKKTQVIQSNDTITLNFDGLPQSKIIAQDGDLKFKANSRFDFELYLPNPQVSSEKEVEELWKKRYVANSRGMEETVVLGRPALQVVNDSNALYYIYLNDVKLPNGIAVFKVSMGATFDFAMMNNTTKADEFQRRYNSQLIPVFQDLNKQFQGIQIKVSKDVQLRNRVNKTGSGINQVMETAASKTSGETSVPIAIAVVVASTAAAVAGAGAAAGTGGGSGDSSSEEKGSGTYKMAIWKDFGDKIKYNADAVYVYARMIEVNTEGIEIDRPDLTQRISIFSEDPLFEVSTATLAGSYMGAGVIAGSAAKAETNSEAVISFRFSGDGGTFQNNVRFKVIGDSYIELERENIFVLASSCRSFELPYKLVNFVDEPDEVMVKPMTDSSLFDLSLEKNKEGKTVILATDKAPQKPIDRFFESFSCEITAKNIKEYARAVFTVVLCYEGILPDFLGKEKQIIAYKNEKGEMPVTDIAFRLGTWNETEKTFALSRPKEVEVSFSDKQGIFEVIGLESEVNQEKSTGDYVVYSFKAEKSLPSTSPIVGTLLAVYNFENMHFESTTEVKLMPDLLTYEKDREKEYKNCVRIINTYLPARFASKKLKELNDDLDKMGLKDLQLFRKKCWEIASRCIMQEKENYLIDSYWYDEAIATAELVVNVGDIALDVALAPFGGPISGFVISQVKSSLIELISMRIERGTIRYNEIYDLIMARLEQAAGQADGLIETPGFDKPKVLIAWLSCYILYRIMYRWYFDKDENGDPKGLSEAIQNGIIDFAGKGASILLGEYAKDIVKKRGIDIDSTADAEQKWVNEKVSSAAKKSLDAMDKVADALDKKIDEIIAVLLDFIDRIRNGGINIY